MSNFSLSVTVSRMTRELFSGYDVTASVLQEAESAHPSESTKGHPQFLMHLLLSLFVLFYFGRIRPSCRSLFLFSSIKSVSYRTFFVLVSQMLSHRIIPFFSLGHRYFFPFLIYAHVRFGQTLLNFIYLFIA